MAVVDNRMVVDEQWSWLRYADIEKVHEQKGYHEMGTNTFVSNEDAYEYALDRCLNGTEEEQKEFKEMLVEWFYSGNWLKEE